MIDPTITGCLIKPLKKTPHGPKKRLAPLFMRFSTVDLAKVEEIIRWVRGKLSRSRHTRKLMQLVQPRLATNCST